WSSPDAGEECVLDIALILEPVLHPTPMRFSEKVRLILARKSSAAIVAILAEDLVGRIGKCRAAAGRLRIEANLHARDDAGDVRRSRERNLERRGLIPLSLHESGGSRATCRACRQVAHARRRSLARGQHNPDASIKRITCRVTGPRLQIEQETS